MATASKQITFARVPSRVGTASRQSSLAAEAIMDDSQVIAEKVQQLEKRRKKPAWATLRAEDETGGTSAGGLEALSTASSLFSLDLAPTESLDQAAGPSGTTSQNLPQPDSVPEAQEVREWREAVFDDGGTAEHGSEGAVVLDRPPSQPANTTAADGSTASSPRRSRREAWESLYRGETSQGTRHTIRRDADESCTFAPQLTARTQRLAAKVYERTAKDGKRLEVLYQQGLSAWHPPAEPEHAPQLNPRSQRLAERAYNREMAQAPVRDRFEYLYKQGVSTMTSKKSPPPPDPAATFAPRISARSRTLAADVYSRSAAEVAAAAAAAEAAAEQQASGAGRDGGPAAPRTEVLYLEGRERHRQRTRLSKTVPQRREDEELKECTFVPELSATSTATASTVAAHGDFLQRIALWAARRQQRLQAERDQLAERSLQDCTFWPDTTASNESLEMLETALSSQPGPAVMELLAATRPHTADADLWRSLDSEFAEGYQAASIYTSQRKYYDRMAKVRERERQVQEVLRKFDGSGWVHHVTRPQAPCLGRQRDRTSSIRALQPPLPLAPGTIAALTHVNAHA